MKIKKVLDIVFPPPMYYSLHVAISMAIILTDKDNYDWYYSNFIQLSFRNDYKEKIGNHILNIYPAELTRPGQSAANLCLTEIYTDRLVHEDIKDNKLIFYVQHFIDNDYYVSALLDVSKLTNSRYKGFFIHGVIVFGYDRDKRIFYTLDFNNREELCILEVSFEDYEKAFNSRLLLEKLSGINNSFNLYKMKKYINGLDIEHIAQELLDYLNSYNTSKKYTMLLPKYIDYTWGISVYEKIIEYLLWIKSVKQANIDYRMFHALYEHKRLMYNRFIYIKNSGVFIINGEDLLVLEEVKVKAELIRFLIIKLKMTNKTDIIDRIITYINQLKRMEYQLYTGLIKGLK